MDRIILEYVEKNRLKLLRIIYDNKCSSYSDLVGYSGLNLIELNAVIKSLISTGHLTSNGNNTCASYYLTKEGCFDYISSSFPEYLDRLLDVFRRNDLNISFAREFLVDKFYDKYKFDSDIDIRVLLDEFYVYANKKGYPLVKKY